MSAELLLSASANTDTPASPMRLELRLPMRWRVQNSEVCLWRRETDQVRNRCGAINASRGGQAAAVHSLGAARKESDAGVSSSKRVTPRSSDRKQGPLMPVQTYLR